MRELPIRKRTRLQNYDYSQAGYYFVTVCVKDRHEMLGKIINGQSVLNEYGIIVRQEIESISSVRKECAVLKYIIMPNHIHLIVQIVGDDGNRPAKQPKERADCHPPLQRSVSNMVQGFKGAVTRKAGFSLWQRSYHDHIIRNEAEYLKIWQYIDENPAKWAEDCYYAL